MTNEFAKKVADYMLAQGWAVDREPGHYNIVYIEGMDMDYRLNENRLDGWNDLSLIIDHTIAGEPLIAFQAVATTEPGRASMMSLDATKRGGVARIKFGQQRAWRMGFHRAAKFPGQHPALVQHGDVFVHRDVNRDGSRVGDPILKAYGINQHSTNAHYKDGPVGLHSAGCLVRKYWADHLEFIRILKKDPRYVRDSSYIFATTVIAGTDLEKIHA